MAEAAKKKDVTRVLKPVRFELTEHANQDKTITVEEGTTLDDVKKPEFYANVAPSLRPYDHIRVRIDTGAWYAEVLVLSCGRNWAKVKVLYDVKLEEKDTDMGKTEGLDKFEYVFRGPHKKHSIVRKIDREVVKEGCESKDEAMQWLADYVKTLE